MIEQNNPILTRGRASNCRVKQLIRTDKQGPHVRLTGKR